MPGRYPAVVKTYDQAKRTCRVEIPGLTEGADSLLEAEIEYPIGDKTKDGPHSTEIAIGADETVWVSFIAGDPRFPVITGYRNPAAGNGGDWRRFHHANLELLAEQLINLIAHGLLTAKSDVQVTIDAPLTRITGTLQVDGAATLGAGGRAVGDLTVTGTVTGETDVVFRGRSAVGHQHKDSQPGAGLTGIPQ